MIPAGSFHRFYAELFLFLYLCGLNKKQISMYPAELVKPMREDLASAGFEELYTAVAVESAIKQDGTVLVVVNSVCGCAAANARPAAKQSLQNSKKPDRLITVFAGVDREAVDAARS